MDPIRQEDRYGCAIACVAMLLDRTYAEMRAAVGEPGHGFTHDSWGELLSRGGYALQHMYRIDQITQRPRAVWPLEPWAPIYVCTVDAGGPGAHLVVMAADGTIIDPATSTLGRLSDYRAVISMTGLYRVKAAPTG